MGSKPDDASEYFQFIEYHEVFGDGKHCVQTCINMRINSMVFVNFPTGRWPALQYSQRCPVLSCLSWDNVKKLRQSNQFKYFWSLRRISRALGESYIQQWMSYPALCLGHHSEVFRSSSILLLHKHCTYFFYFRTTFPQPIFLFI